MASFAKIGLNNKVIAVHSVHNNELLDSNGVEQEVLGVEFLTNLHGWAIWKQTSYNTTGGVHLLGGTPFRKNHAGIGYTYDEDRDAFIPKKPFNSWILNETTCLWEAPITYPTITDDTANPVVWNWSITWNETTYQADNTKGWEGTKNNVDGTDHTDTATYDWNGTDWVAQ